MSRQNASPFSPKEIEFIVRHAEKGKSAEQIRDKLVEKFSVKRKVRLVEDELQRLGIPRGRNLLVNDKWYGDSLPDPVKSFAGSSTFSIRDSFSPMEIDLVKKLMAEKKTPEDICAKLVKKFARTREVETIEKLITRINEGWIVDKEPSPAPTVTFK